MSRNIFIVGLLAVCCVPVATENDAGQGPPPPDQKRPETVETVFTAGKVVYEDKVNLMEVYDRVAARCPELIDEGFLSYTEPKSGLVLRWSKEDQNAQLLQRTRLDFQYSPRPRNMRFPGRRFRIRMFSPLPPSGNEAVIYWREAVLFGEENDVCP